MIFVIHDLLSPEVLATINQDLAAAEFVDGQLTAGWHAKSVKQNQQLSPQAPSATGIQSTIEIALRHNRLFQTAVRPQQVRPVLINRYDAGMSYGVHTDNALMQTASGLLRSDVSMTLFLSPPETYVGGELAIETSSGETCFKLAAGSAIVYPSSTLHAVRKVTEGVRLAAVTWIQSLVRDPAHREILFELDTVRQSIFERQGKTTEFDLISKSLSNLLREWVEL
ncbi:Fe2+-dependent dioxygenase [filamentous cyanobacterium LEGE 11480]|uniref:Fe2+-dependent dioxygenase n=1 Tax=Romeriopsis navalis LEGE 11480 TaxID=2777977 RepID=A0A928VMB8_9CYAN|nr:Fe2+-dependent dioxygenase [Romeriopsis navalis]MBE9030338.1 Fe2+-dependent dioxygenase [Romeriopsis navalis LEGE 11480]